MRVKDVMKDPIVTERDITLEQTAKIMSDRMIGSLVFIDNKGKAAGIITHTDIVRNFGQSKNISEIMAKKVISVSSGDTLERAVEVMKKNRIDTLPVMDKGELVGIISARDLLYETYENEDFLID